MLRLARRRNYAAVSPSAQQRARSVAPEYIPLVMEPESRFYADPVVVLDFQVKIALKFLPGFDNDLQNVALFTQKLTVRTFLPLPAAPNLLHYIAML